MRRLQQLALIGILTFTGVAHAQNRNGNFRNGNDGQRGYGNRFDILDRTQDDLNRLTRIRLDSRDLSRVNDITRNLQQFEARLAQGNFDKDRLDHIIETTQNLANSHRIPQAAQVTLNRDAQDLRQFRANRGYVGVTGNNGYRR